MAAASAGGLGYSPVAPGTVGSVAGVVLYAVIHGWPWWLYFGIVYALFFIGAHAADLIQESLGQRDPGLIVIDEVVGMLIAVFSFPLTWKYMILGFILFRLFDIFKPFPCRYIDHNWTDGKGVMADDVFAGVYANLCLQAFRALGWI